MVDVSLLAVIACQAITAAANFRKLAVSVKVVLKTIALSNERVSIRKDAIRGIVLDRGTTALGFLRRYTAERGTAGLVLRRDAPVHIRPCSVAIVEDKDRCGPFALTFFAREDFHPLAAGHDNGEPEREPEGPAPAELAYPGRC